MDEKKVKKRRIKRKKKVMKFYDFMLLLYGIIVGLLLGYLLIQIGMSLQNSLNHVESKSFEDTIEKGRLSYIASVIAAEAAGEGEIGMYAVACVIQNRMNKEKLSAKEIVNKHKQFFGATAKNRKKLYMSVKDVADSIASNIGKLKDITYGATHFENIRAFGTPKWSKNQCAKIGNHVFYKLY
jgi:hypothetical protein